MNIETRGPLEGADRVQALGLLRTEGYSQAIDDADDIFAAWLDSEPAAAVRLAPEQGVTVLRGLRVRRDLRRRGIGRQLLEMINHALGADECWCIPYGWLTGFYGTVGFDRVEPGQAPAFLAERHSTYRNGGLDVVIMRRRPKPEVQ